MESTLFYSPRFLDVNNSPKKAFNGLCHQCPNSAHNIIIIVIYNQAKKWTSVNTFTPQLPGTSHVTDTSLGTSMT